jgi:hypothetical protein
VSVEFGIFTDEGIIEGGFYDRAKAEIVMERDYSEEDAHVAECCHDHPENEREYCEECEADDEDES